MNNSCIPIPAAVTGEPKTGSRWGQDRRLEFIDFRLQWDGRLNRSDLTDFFGISVPQASLDIARYQDARPGNMEYDRSLRVYVATSVFSPVFPVSHPSRYLNELLAAATGVLPRDATFVGWWPPVGIAPMPAQTLDVEVLTALLRAMRNRTGLRLRYQSTAFSDPQSRAMTPHALTFDGLRWHVRAFCHLESRFRDFAITRMLKVEGEEPAGLGGADDAEWQTVVTLVLAPNPELEQYRARVVELDYGMVDGELHLSCRQALLFHTLRQLGLRNGSAAKPGDVPLVLVNRDEVESLLPA
ncbi:MAG TPA: WYL domain-containing protein [Trinickia sp.]|uniref:helix-turn-helix transcriptional regulator n=1 Tax=Trinickia sp. TaxID=2571163 RepID=UPI002F3F44B4